MFLIFDYYKVAMNVPRNVFLWMYILISPDVSPEVEVLGLRIGVNMC